MKEPLFLIIVVTVMSLFAVGFIEHSVMVAVENMDFTQ